MFQVHFKDFIDCEISLFFRQMESFFLSPNLIFSKNERLLSHLRTSSIHHVRRILSHTGCQDELRQTSLVNAARLQNEINPSSLLSSSSTSSSLFFTSVSNCWSLKNFSTEGCLSLSSFLLFSSNGILHQKCVSLPI